ncbi:MAG: ATP-binding protein, partial [Cyanobacteriota bacterium]
MNISGYIRQDVLNKLLSNNGTVENVSQIINEINKSESISALKHINTNLLINRKDEINEISSFFEDETQRLLLVGGIQGAGKSTIIRTTIANCQEHVLIYWYECSKVTNLDDILLSLCAFFDKKVGKSKFPPKQKTVISIDERLISYLKTLEREMILVLDSIEYLVSPEFTIKDDELKQFFNYLLSHPKVKVVLIGQRLPTGDMEYVEDFITEIRLAGLNEQYAINLMRGNGLNASNSSLYELYKYSRGYPWGILLTASIAKRLKIKPEKIIHDLASYEDSYESFLIKSIYGELNDIERSLLDYLSVIRHPINIPTFCNLDKLFQDPEHFLDELLKIKLVRTTGKRYHVNATVRKYVYNFVPFEEKYALHLTISKFYANEMSKNLADRTIRLSRNLLRSEQFYHNSTATKFYTSKDQFEQKNKYVDTLQQKTSKDDRHVQENINNKTMQQRLLQGFEMLNAEKTNDSDDVSAMDLDTSFQLQLPGQHQTPSKEIINIDGYQIELTEEEKELLKEAEKEIQSEKIVKNKTFNITENIVEYIDTEQESIANIEENVSELSNIDDLSLEFDIDTSDEESIQSNIDLVESLVFVAQGYANENKHNIAIERYKEALDICEKSNILNNTAKTLMLMAESYLSLKQYKLSLDCY